VISTVDDKHGWTEPREQDRLTQPDVLTDPAKALEVVAQRLMKRHRRAMAVR